MDKIDDLLTFTDGYIVGGYLRDELRSCVSKDLDIATPLTPDEVKLVLTRMGLSFHCVGEKFGTIGTNIDGLDVELTTFRTEQYTNGSRKPEVTFGTTLYEDLKRRDFTFNALARKTHSGTDYIDPFNGREDLARGIIRCVGDPVERFTEDPLRMLRAVRFTSRFTDTYIELETEQGVMKCAHMLERISTERIRDEFIKTLNGNGCIYALGQLQRLGLIEYILPHHTHIVRIPNDDEPLMVKLAIIFGEHAELTMEHLKFSNNDKRIVNALIKLRDTVTDLTDKQKIIRTVGLNTVKGMFSGGNNLYDYINFEASIGELIEDFEYADRGVVLRKVHEETLKVLLLE